MTLALRLGKTLNELTNSLSSSELKMWMAYDKMSPIGDSRGDVLAAMISSATLNSQGAKVTVSELMPVWEPKERDHQSDEAAGGFESFLGSLAS